jgi:hypothetical protein
MRWRNTAVIDSNKDSRALPLILAALVVAWAAMGWRDLPQTTQAGFDTDGDHVVTRVAEGSPAAAAGLAVGDVITHIERIPVAQASAIARLPRVRAGVARNYAIERAGEERVVAVRFEPLTPRALSLERVSTIIGLSYLLFPLLAWLQRPTDATRVLLVMGVGVSLAFISGPYIAEAGIRAVTAAVVALFVATGIAAMVQFLLVFPHRRPWLQRGPGKTLLYLPALLLWALLAYRILFMPPATSVLNMVTNLVSVIVTGGYCLMALFLMLRNYSRTDRVQRKALKLNGMLWGTVFGILPALLAQLVAAFSPASALPAQDAWFASLVLIPFAWARSASRENT